MTRRLTETITYLEHPSDVIGQAAALIKSHRRFALITSVAIEGGAAREVGSLALVDDQGQMHGYLSNGCIDRDIQHHATVALSTGQKQVLRYGSGSRYADLKLPCGGALDVLIDPTPDATALLGANDALLARQPTVLTFELPDAPQTAVSFAYTPKFRLFLAGRGAIFRAMAQVGASAGFALYLLSPETDDLAAVAALSPDDPVHLTSPQQTIHLKGLDQFGAFLTLFHDHEWEPALLRAALGTPALFIGSLGSMRTHALRCEALRQDGVPEADIDRLHGPIGLVPSLREAPLIAVSAMAEVITALPKSVTPAS